MTHAPGEFEQVWTAPMCARDTETLFPRPLLEPTDPSARQGEPFTAPADPKRGARIREANRAQMAWGRIDLEAQLSEEHAARAIWSVVERLELSALYAHVLVAPPARVFVTLQIHLTGFSAEPAAGFNSPPTESTL